MPFFDEPNARPAAPSGIAARAMAARSNQNNAPDYLNGLNPEQRLAVETTEGPVLVLAGAGTGKTRVLTTRIAHILATGKAFPSQILAVTFTNKAAREMKQRIGLLIGDGNVEGMPWLGTFHSIGVKLLRRHAELAGLKSDFTILDTDDVVRLIKQLIQAEGLDDKRWPAKQFAQMIDGWKNKGLGPADIPEGDARAFANGKGRELYKAYQERLKTLNACDFGDLLCHPIRIFRANPDVLKEYHKRFRYILVDEYQDTNTAQYMWLRLLAQRPQSSPLEGEEILFYVASRGHHADIGGTAPGSMTPLATTVDEEGVLFDNFRIVDRGRFREKDLETLLTDHPYPARNPHQNIADLKAQIAANEKGVAELRKMVAHFGLDVVEAYMGHVQDNAAESVRRVLERLPDSSEYEYPTDTGQMIRVKISVDRRKREATVDFTGTSPVMKNNFNAPEPVARAAVLYAFRVMVEDNIPMNAGCLRPINIIIPDGSMLKPAYPAAVVAGNVETSQHVTNALFGAMGAMANAQGTMNNLTFGNKQYQYYETICSGSPAGRMNDGRGFAGTSGVHTHMTNSRLTDPEVLELRFPVLLEDFHIREGSGGRGKWNAGDGTKRTIRFLEKMECAILSSHRNRPPQGLDGGGDGEVGSTKIRRKDGRVEVLKACDQTVLDAGEAVIVTTPTPGGFGKA
ncbi:hydantoinase B/oxoprolinase family protein [Mesorhizobium sp.]|uniref:hydantoinase B/oxoprolinase family protein n=1 Tax=Mesorhizobium sp. TaxID=1871066 RepID=UPI00344EF052